MKIFISADIEGITGVSSWEETTVGKHGYDYARKQLVREINACCETLIAQNITEIYVKDAHDSGLNLFPDDLPIGVNLVRGWSGAPWEMLDGLDKTFDAAIFIGYHSPCRSNGSPISHTFSPDINHIKINNKVVSEFLLNAYYAKTLNVPVIMVTGDDNLTKIVNNENSEIITVATGIGNFGGYISKNPDEVVEEIKKATKRAIALLNDIKKHDFFVILPKTLETEIFYRNHRQAYRASFYPGAKALNADKTIFVSNSIVDTLKFINFTI